MRFQPFYYAVSNPFRLREEMDFLLTVPPLDGISSVFKFYGARLGFPRAETPDWEWFEDCVSDLEWVPAHRIILAHEAVPEFESPSDLTRYIRALWNASGYMHDFDHHELLVIFPPDARDGIESALETEEEAC